jgi:hypothetical protein
MGAEIADAGEAMGRHIVDGVQPSVFLRLDGLWTVSAEKALEKHGESLVRRKTKCHAYEAAHSDKMSLHQAQRHDKMSPNLEWRGDRFEALTRGARPWRWGVSRAAGQARTHRAHTRKAEASGAKS